MTDRDSATWTGESPGEQGANACPCDTDGGTSGRAPGSTFPSRLREGLGEGAATLSSADRWSRMALVHRLDPRLLEFARALRRNATDAERLVWSLVRNKRLAGFKFRRQHPLGPYIVDFLCVRARLAIEIDGGHHWTDAQQRHDRRRSEFIRRRGIRELRFTNIQVLRETESVLEAIWLSLNDRS